MSDIPDFQDLFRLDGKVALITGGESNPRISLWLILKVLS